MPIDTTHAQGNPVAQHINPADNGNIRNNRERFYMSSKFYHTMWRYVQLLYIVLHLDASKEHHSHQAFCEPALSERIHGAMY